MKARALVLALGLAPSSVALADGIPETIEVGETIERAVGFARGVACDAPDVVVAGIRTEGGTNVVSFTGRQVGQTLCRAGTDPFRPSYVFAITVTPPRRS